MADFDAMAAATDPADAGVELELEAALAEGRPVEVASAPPAPLGRTPAYDFIGHRFLPAAAGGPIMLHGRASLGQWVVKCLYTPRGGALAVHPDFGLEGGVDDLLDGGPFDESASAELYDRVCEALTVHPRIADVDNWKVDYEPGDDFVAITFRVVVERTEDDPLEDLRFNDFPYR